MSRQRLLAAWVAWPVVVLAVVGVWSTASSQPGGALWPADRVTLAEAIVTANYAEVAYQLERGADPNLPVDIREDLLVGHPVRVTPAQAAVWARNAFMLQMLLDHGLVVGPTSLAVLRCLNAEHPDRDVQTILDAQPSAPAPSCDALPVPE